MSSYREQLALLRNARAERDAARSAVSSLKQRQLRLMRTQRHAERKELRREDPAAERSDAVHERLASEVRELHVVDQGLRQLAERRKAAARRVLLSERLARELEALRSTPGSATHAAPREHAARLAALRAKVDALRVEHDAFERSTHGDARRQAELASRRQALTLSLNALRIQLAGESPASRVVPDQGQEIAATRQAVAQGKELLRARDRAVGMRLDELFRDRDPQALIEEWSDDFPIVLLPLRLETRFKLDAAKPELWVRVFPDEIAVNAHERVLMERERDSGFAYFAALRAATTEEQKRDAWLALTGKFGANRAAWIALQTRPLNWRGTDPPPPDEALEFPEITATKIDGWTEAPHSRVMPDRLVLLRFRAGAVFDPIVGAPLKDLVVVGPAPLEGEDQPSISRDAEGRLQLGEDFAWVADFEKAVECGLGFKVPLDPASAEDGFNRLLVLGLKLSGDHTDGQRWLEELIDDHHFSSKGFALVKQGTATNNTDEDSGFDGQDWLSGASYFTETGPALFTPTNNPLERTDAQRLAEYLGISYARLEHVSNGNVTDHAEAVAMNRALYAGTLGYYFDAMLNGVLDSEAQDRLRGFFTEYVTGRGPLAAIRVGKQPYGLLVTSSFESWQAPNERSDPFQAHLVAVLVELTRKWRTLASGLPHLASPGDASTKLMGILGLQPTSAEYYQRVGYSFDYLKNLADFAWDGRYFEDVLRRTWEEAAGRAYLAELGYERRGSDGRLKPEPTLLKLIFRHYHTRLDDKNLVDGEPLSEERGIKPWNEALGKNYIDWLFDNSAQVDALERQFFGSGVAHPTALLYLLLRNALLLEARRGIHVLLGKHSIAADELIRTQSFSNLSAEPDVSPWEVFRAPAHRVIPGETSTKPLLEYVQQTRFTRATEADVGSHLAQVKEALERLRGLPTARLERVLAEHIDSVNYRLDAWQTALFEQRLRDLRQLDTGNARREGVFLGAYGYLENVKPAKARRQKIDEEALPAELREGIDNLYSESENGGYVQAPSLNHAAAAAILRSGYLTHATDDEGERERLAVNLSSERVRRALYLIEGIRKGQTLEALLGYLFERGMHDVSTRADNPIPLDRFIPALRRAFPIERTRLPRRGHPGEPAETTQDFSVVNGLRIAETGGTFPNDVPSIPTLDDESRNALRHEKDSVKNSLDALRDVLTAESAYQLALGNFDRAAAVAQAISNGELPPDIEVIRSSRGTNLSFTHRVVVALDPALGDNPWPTVSMTRRALTEPALNDWVGQLLGDPNLIRCQVSAVGSDGVVLSDGAGPIRGLVTLAELDLQPLDFIAIIQQKLESAAYSELEARVRYEFARARQVTDTTIVSIEFAESGGTSLSVRSFAEVLPLADALRRVIGRARPSQASDFVSASKHVAAPADNPGNLDVDELETRVLAIRSDVDTLMSQLAGAASDAETLRTEAALDLLRECAKAVSDVGLVHAFPLSAYGFSEGALSDLVEHARSLARRYVDITAGWDDKLAKVNAAATPARERARLLTEMAKSVLGESFALLPRFSLLNAADVALAYTHRDELLDFARDQKKVPFPVDEWLHGAALVRPELHLFARVLMLGVTFGAPEQPLAPLQLPYREDDTWLGVEFPPGTAILHDTLSLVLLMPQGFEAALPLAGFTVDEWVEALPQEREVTGVAFNFNQPDSAPPQAILLAVSPRRAGRWHFGDLVDAVLDTFERAKLRAVEPERVESLPGIAALLPATLAEFSTGKGTISLDYSLNLTLMNSMVMSLVLNTEG